MLIKCLNKDCMHEFEEQCTRDVVYIGNDLQCKDYSVQTSLFLDTLTKDMRIELFAQPGCQACIELQRELDENKIEYISFDVQADDEALYRLLSLGAMSTPTVIINKDTVLAGCDFETFKYGVLDEIRASKIRKAGGAN